VCQCYVPTLCIISPHGCEPDFWETWIVADPLDCVEWEVDDWFLCAVKACNFQSDLSSQYRAGLRPKFHIRQPSCMVSLQILSSCSIHFNFHFVIQQNIGTFSCLELNYTSFWFSWLQHPTSCWKNWSHRAATGSKWTKLEEMPPEQIWSHPAAAFRACFFFSSAFVLLEKLSDD
jgi:hypothetical protein